MPSTRLTASLAASLYSCRTTWGSLSSSSANISLYCLQYEQQRQNIQKNDKSKSGCFIWTDDEVELLLKVCIEYKTSKTNGIQIGSFAKNSQPNKNSKNAFWLAAMLFCSLAVKTTVETGPDLPTSSDSKVVSGFDRPHVSEEISESKVSTLESEFKSFRIRRSDSLDVCGRRAYLKRKVYGFESIRIRVDGA